MFRLGAMLAGIGLTVTLSAGAAAAAAPSSVEALQRALQAVDVELQEFENLPAPGSATPLPSSGPFKEADEASRSVMFELQDAGIMIPEAALKVLRLMPPALLDVNRPTVADYHAASRALQEAIDSPEQGAESMPPAAGQAPNLRPPVTASLAPGSENSNVIAVGAVAVALLGLAIGSFAMWRGRRHDELAVMARTDGLTGLLNRRRFDLDLEAATRRGKSTTAAMMVDIDHFKRFNDSYGHACGDDVLRRVATAIGPQLRRGDIAYRYGGEEFSVLLPGAEDEDARVVAERIRLTIESLPVVDGESVTVSIGVASGAASDLNRVVSAADRALFRAKDSGRNCTVVDHQAAPATS